jgi:hypothetical protein
MLKSMPTLTKLNLVQKDGVIDITVLNSSFVLHLKWQKCNKKSDKLISKVFNGYLPITIVDV